MYMKFADTKKGWYQERTCSILAALSLVVEANNRMDSMGGSPLRWVYYHAMQYHFERAVFDTLRLLQILTRGTDIANSANVKAICEEGHMGFLNIIDGNMDGFDLEKE